MIKKNKEFIIFGAPLIEKPEIEEVVATLKSGWLGKGPKVEKFERMFSRYKGTKFAAGVSSCTAALHLSLSAIGEDRRGEVILPTMTFAGTANAVINAGKKPVLADCLLDTGNIDPQDLKRKLNRRTLAIVPVHLAGRPCEMEPLMSLKRKHGFILVEDCAHAIESEYKGRKTGTFGEFGCFSFYVTKNITTGDGGMIITDNPEYDKKIKVLAMQGMSKDAWGRFSDLGYKHYGLVDHGYKYSMTDIQASMGIHQLPRIDQYWNKRRIIWNRYNKAFKGLPVFLPADCPQNIRHSYNLYSLFLDIDNLKFTRDEFLRELFRRGVGSGVHFIALHLHPYYRKAFGYKKGDFPNAEWISFRTVSLPLSPKLTQEDIAKVIKTVADILKAKFRRKYL